MRRAFAFFQSDGKGTVMTRQRKFKNQPVQNVSRVISCDGVWYLTIEGFVVATVSCISNGGTPRNGTPAPKMRPSGGLVFKPVFQR